MRVSDCCTSSRDVTRCCCSARCISLIEASTTEKPRGVEGAAATAIAAENARTTNLVLIGGRRRAKRPACLLQQVGLDERIQVAVEHSIDVADFHLRSVI